MKITLMYWFDWLRLEYFSLKLHISVYITKSNQSLNQVSFYESKKNSYIWPKIS